MFPLTFNDLLIWITLTSIILTTTIALINPYHGQISLKINKKRIKRIMYLVGVIYFILISIKIYEIINE